MTYVRHLHLGTYCVGPCGPTYRFRRTQWLLDFGPSQCASLSRDLNDSLTIFTSPLSTSNFMSLTYNYN
jgi:hypothetical protein